jgi:hypothetical protein
MILFGEENPELEKLILNLREEIQVKDENYNNLI